MSARHYDPYSFPAYLQRNPVRRIWRIIYPALLFLAIQLLVSLIFSFSVAMFYGVSETFKSGLTAAGGALPDTSAAITAAMAKTEAFIVKYSMHIVLLTDIIALAVFLPMWLKTRKYRPAVITRTSPARPLILTALFVPGVSFLISILIGLLGMNEMSENFQQVMEMITGTSFVLQIVAVAIIGPIAEELIFRGVLLNRALSWMPKWAAIVLSSAMFGVIHMNVPQGIFAFCIGLICGWSYVRFRSILVPIAAHIAINLTSTVMNRLAQNVDVTNPTAGIPMTIFMLAVFVVSLAVIYPWLKTKNANLVYPQFAPAVTPSEEVPVFNSQEFVWRIAEIDD